MESIYSESIFKKVVILNSNTLTKNIDLQLKNKLKELSENKCNNEGFIKKDSIEIIKRYNAFIKSNICLSNVSFTILFKCQICNPKPNMILECKIIEIIKPGLICELFPLSIILPEQLHFNKKLYNTIKINDTVKIKILNSKFHINEMEIQCVGVLIDDKEKKVININNKNAGGLDEEIDGSISNNDGIKISDFSTDDEDSLDDEDDDEDDDEADDDEDDNDEDEEDEDNLNIESDIDDDVVDNVVDDLDDENDENDDGNDDGNDDDSNLPGLNNNSDKDK